MKTYSVYLLASQSGVLYSGITSDLENRVQQHRAKVTPGFTSRYNVNRLVYFEIFGDVRTAIAREKQIKRWRREKRVALIESKNPKWADLYEELLRRRADETAKRDPSATSRATRGTRSG